MQYGVLDSATQRAGLWEETEEGLYTRRTGSFLLFTFRGDAVSVRAIVGRSAGKIKIILDGRGEGLTDCARSGDDAEETVFIKKGLTGDIVHNLFVTCVLEKDQSLTVTGFTAPEGVDYPAELKRQMFDEYAVIQKGEKSWLPPEAWRPVPYRAISPVHGVRLREGPVRKLYDDNLTNVKYCFSIPDYCEGDTPEFVKPLGDGHGWSRWLPGSNEGRLLAGAAWALCSEEDAELRSIVNTILSDIKSRMREDGYANYYPEADSYARIHTMEQSIDDPNRDGLYSERKNYDRVFWTRGLIAAYEAGNPDALPLLRRMYDWFNAAGEYLPRMLEGGNATNGVPGGPLMYHTPLGKPEDLITSERFFDQDYWFLAFMQRQPMALSHYPGERPHCYDLLQFEALADEYRATGDPKYLDALLGAWDLYLDNYKHIGGATAICEMDGPYPPKSYYLTTGHNGETCGSVFWVWTNQRLMQLFPEEEKYPAQIEEAIINILCAARTDRGYTRYHNRLHGEKEEGKNENTCCEVSSTMMISAIPQYLYLQDEKGLIVNQYFASSYEGDGFALHLDSEFPEKSRISIRIETPGGQKEIDLRLRIPEWAIGSVSVAVNSAGGKIACDAAKTDGKAAYSGNPGGYVSLHRIWSDGDSVTFDLPFALRTQLYEGTDQTEGNEGRYAVTFGPVLLALTGDFSKDAIPALRHSAKDIDRWLRRGENLVFAVAGDPSKKFIPYYAVGDEPFTCFPVMEP